MTDWKTASDELMTMLGLSAPPIAITFVGAQVAADAKIDGFTKPLSEPTDDGRIGRVPASCVFWVEAQAETFSTVGEDHGNCSVGNWVHGFVQLDDIVNAADVGALFESGLVTSDDVGGVQFLDTAPDGIVYGPLSDSALDPDVVVLMLNPAQMMELSDAIPALELSGKPQCQIIPKAAAGTAAVSMGCALSRERTGMGPDLLTCAVPASDIVGVVERLRQVVRADEIVIGYAENDKSRFEHV